MKHFVTREVAKILQLSEDRVRTCVRAGSLSPERASDGEYHFTFQDLVLLRTTKGLLDSGVPPQRIRRAWSSLKRQLSADLPLSSLTIYADGRRVVAWDGNARWQPDSGQFLFNFDVGEVAEQALPTEEVAAPLPIVKTPNPEAPAVSAARQSKRSDAAPRPALTADQWFNLACELEQSSPEEARHAYQHALELDPMSVEANVNLGRTYHEANELGKAEAHYRAAITAAPDDPTGHFNLGVLLEDRDRPEEAIAAYQRAIACDPDCADAHYNLGLLLESLGRRSQAIAHLMAARKLYGDSQRQP